MLNESITSASKVTLNQQQKDEVLWSLARKRAGFKRGLTAYLLVNSLLIATWFFTDGRSGYFWPIWPIAGWGIGIVFQYLHAYHGNQFFSAEKEYEKLKNQQ